jgi:hypothetical protein
MNSNPDSGIENTRGESAKKKWPMGWTMWVGLCVQGIQADVYTLCSIYAPGTGTADRSKECWARQIEDVVGSGQRVLQAEK